MATWDDNLARVLITLIKSPVAYGVLILAVLVLEGAEMIHIPVLHEIMAAVGGLLRP